MKFRNQAWLCLAVFDFEATLCLTFQATGLSVRKKFNFNVATN